MSYDAKYVPNSHWKIHLAFGVVKSHPTFPDDGVTGSLTYLHQGIQGEGSAVFDEILSSIPSSVEDKSSPVTKTNSPVASTRDLKLKKEYENSDTAPSAKRCMERKTALRVCLIEIYRSKAIQNSRRISDSLNRRNKLAMERTALLAYRRSKYETTKDLEDRAAYLRLIGKERLFSLGRRLSGTIQGEPATVIEQMLT